MQVYLLFLLLLCGAAGVFSACFALGIGLLQRQPRKLLFPASLRRWWGQAVGTDDDEKWEKLLRKAGHPFGWGKAEWVAVQFVLGMSLFLVILTAALFRGDDSFPYVTITLIPGAGFLLPRFVLKSWANYREEILSVDIARFINRYVNLLENQVPVYLAMVKAARPTRKLKEYIPTLSEWNRDRFAALETLKRELGVDDAILLVSHMRTVEQLSTGQLGLAMQRLEWSVDNRRMFRHRRKIKSLGIGYSIIVYPAFYIGLIVAMFPWYKLLTEILDKYLV